jgi:isopenicillin-N epimerase
MANQDASRTAPIADAGRHFLLRPDIIFLNHCCYGAYPASGFAIYQRRRRELEAEPVKFLGRSIRSLVEETRQPLAAPQTRSRPV